MRRDYSSSVKSSAGFFVFGFFLTLFHDVMAAEGAILKHTEIKVNFIGNIKFA